MRYRASDVAWRDGYLGVTWPRHAYDGWEFEQASLEAGVLRPGPERAGSFSAGADSFAGARRARRRATTTTTTRRRRRRAAVPPRRHRPPRRHSLADTKS